MPDFELTITVIVYFCLSLPLFGIGFREKEMLRTPRHYIPVEWYKQSDLPPGVSVDLTYTFKSNKAKRLFQEASKLEKAAKYEEAKTI